MKAETLNPSDLATYSASEVASLVDIDIYAVRDEGERRAALAEKRIASLQKQLAKAMELRNDANLILSAAFNHNTDAD